MVLKENKIAARSWKDGLLGAHFFYLEELIA
jgi:hypothetical protein